MWVQTVWSCLLRRPRHLTYFIVPQMWSGGQRVFLWLKDCTWPFRVWMTRVFVLFCFRGCLGHIDTRFVKCVRSWGMLHVFKDTVVFESAVTVLLYKQMVVVKIGLLSKVQDYHAYREHVPFFHSSCAIQGTRTSFYI